MKVTPDEARTHLGIELKLPLDAELLLYKSCHALRSAIAPGLDSRRRRSRDRKKRKIIVILLRSSLLGSRSCKSLEALGNRDGQMLLIGVGYSGRRRNLRPSSDEAQILLTTRHSI